MSGRAPLRAEASPELRTGARAFLAEPRRTCTPLPGPGRAWPGSARTSDATKLAWRRTQPYA
eukprot:1398046-Pyramimonas_sp.AAC.1